MPRKVVRFASQDRAEAYARWFSRPRRPPKRGDASARPPKRDDFEVRRMTFTILLCLSLASLFPLSLLPFERDLLLQATASLLSVMSCAVAIFCDPWSASSNRARQPDPTLAGPA